MLRLGGKKPEKTEEVMKNVSDILKKHQEKNK